MPPKLNESMFDFPEGVDVPEFEQDDRDFLGEIVRDPSKYHLEAQFALWEGTYSVAYDVDDRETAIRLADARFRMLGSYDNNHDTRYDDVLYIVSPDGTRETLTPDEVRAYIEQIEDKEATEQSEKRPEYKQVNFRIDEDVLYAIRMMATHKGISMSKYINSVLAEHAGRKLANGWDEEYLDNIARLRKAVEEDQDQ